VSHAVVTDVLHQQRFLPRAVWELGKDRRAASQAACLIVEDRVPDPRSSRFLDLVRAQYRGNGPRVVEGRGVGSAVHTRGTDQAGDPIDSRVYAPDGEGKTQRAQCPEMVVHALDQEQLRARTIPFDGWYAPAGNLQGIHRRQRASFPTRESPRLVSRSTEPGYLHPGQVQGTPARMTAGVLVKLKGVPSLGRLLKLVAPDGDSDGVLTTDLEEPRTAQGAQDSSDVRGQGDALPRGLKQLTGTEQCQGRAARAQRHPFAGCEHAGVA